LPVPTETLLAQCAQTIDATDFPSLGTRIQGKVRDSYVKGGRRTIVATDRISAFDVVLGTVPLKGQILNELAAFWFERTRDFAPNHIIDVPDPNITVAMECELVPVEFVVRGYLTGISNTSIWTAYERGERVYCGHELPDGMHKHQRLPAPLLTPTTKAAQGEHDEPISREGAISRGLVSAARYDEAQELASALFAEGQRWAEKQGLILVDTKYEMGLDSTGRLTLIDEVHTPDSSRYWNRDGYDDALAAGVDPTALDKEFVRRWLVERGYRGEGTPPALPDELRCEAARRYIETFEIVTGQAFEADTEAPIERMRRNLGI
jgi:phosphoribosylaminoimidazole-succinocarboxamide synthase